MSQRLNKDTILSICAKCSDLFSATLRTKEGTVLVEQVSDYVPGFMPEEHYGDYVMLDIDVETGQITNWKKPTCWELNKGKKEQEKWNKLHAEHFGRQG